MAPQDETDRMTMSIAHQISCDAPDCGASAMSPHATAKFARAQFRAMGWTLFRWRRPKYRRETVIHETGYVRRSTRDVGGPGRILCVCSRHRAWRPRSGVELPLPAIPRFK